MKILYCMNCRDIIKLRQKQKECECGHSGGIYTDNMNIKYWGQAIVIGFDNRSFYNALANQPQEGLGESFSAFVMPKKFDHAHKIKKEGTWQSQRNKKLKEGSKTEERTRMQGNLGK